MLSVALGSEQMDRILWYCLGIHTFQVARGVPFLVAMALAASGRPLDVSPRHLMEFRVAAYLVVLALAARRLWLAEAGVPVPPLTDQRQHARRSPGWTRTMDTGARE